MKLVGGIKCLGVKKFISGDGTIVFEVVGI